MVRLGCILEIQLIGFAEGRKWANDSKALFLSNSQDGVFICWKENEPDLSQNWHGGRGVKEQLGREDQKFGLGMLSLMCLLNIWIEMKKRAAYMNLELRKKVWSQKAWLISMKLGSKDVKKEEVSTQEQLSEESRTVQELSSTSLFGCWGAGAGPVEEPEEQSGVGGLPREAVWEVRWRKCFKRRCLHLFQMLLVGYIRSEQRISHWQAPQEAWNALVSISLSSLHSLRSVEASCPCIWSRLLPPHFPRRECND